MLDQHPELEHSREHKQRFQSPLVPPSPTVMWESPSTAPAFHLVNSSRKRDVFGCLITNSLEGEQRNRLPLLQYCSLFCAGCPTYTCLSRQVPGFLLQQKRTFPFDSCCLLPSLAHSGHLFSYSNTDNNFAGKAEIQNSASEILQESFAVQNCKVTEESKC